MLINEFFLLHLWQRRIFVFKHYGTIHHHHASLRKGNYPHHVHTFHSKERKNTIKINIAMLLLNKLENAMSMFIIYFKINADPVINTSEALSNHFSILILQFAVCFCLYTAYILLNINYY